MLDYGKYDYTLWDVVKEERRPLTGQGLQDEFEAYYSMNGDLLDAHREAARAINDAGLKVSARALTELVRWLSYYWPVLKQLVAVYSRVIVNHGAEYKIPNATSPGLTRYLEAQGFDVTKSRSKLDEVRA